MSVRADTLVAVPGRASRRRREAFIGLGLLFPSAALVLAFTIFPVGYNVWLGFYAKHSLRATSTWVGLGNYALILTDPDFWRSVWLATVYAVASTALQIVAGVAGALILHRRFAGCDFLRGVALSELEHAALIDGANRAQALCYVVAPLALPGIIATAIFTFIVAWNDFLFALVLIGKDELKTLAIGINDFFHMAVVDWGLIMAAGVMVTIPALIFFVAVQRYLIAGWGAGGIKG